MGFEEKPKNLKEDIVAAAQGNEEAKARLSRVGKKGAETRARNKAIEEVISNEEFDRMVESEIERIESDSESEGMTDAEIREQAERTATSLLAMREKQKKMIRAHSSVVNQQEDKGSVDPIEDLKKQAAEGNKYAKKALEFLHKE